MAIVSVLRFTVRLSDAGGFFDLVTPQGVLPTVQTTLESTAAVIATLNGRSPTFDTVQRIWSSTGGMSQQITNNILASIPPNAAALGEANMGS